MGVEVRLIKTLCLLTPKVYMHFSLSHSSSCLPFEIKNYGFKENCLVHTLAPRNPIFVANSDSVGC